MNKTLLAAALIALAITACSKKEETVVVPAAEVVAPAPVVEAAPAAPAPEAMSAPAAAPVETAPAK